MRNAECGIEATEKSSPRIVFGSWGEAVAVVPGEVRVWVVNLDSPPLAVGALFDSLTTDERARAENYRAARPRHHFVVGRGLLRRLLGECLGVEPCDVPITYTAGGKPVLAGAGPHFNVTHTDGLALIAVADRPVGVDVEQIRTIANPAGLVGRFFSPAEREAYAELPEEHRTVGFFRGWTCKEAVLKAAGLSVLNLDTFDVELHPLRAPGVLAARHEELAKTSWTLAAWEAAPGFAAAVALADSGS